MSQPSVILATASYDHTIRFWEAKSGRCYRTIQYPDSEISYDLHTNNVMAVGFQCDGKWMYSGSEDGTVKIWDTRAPGCQREYESRAAVNTVVLHPNQLSVSERTGGPVSTDLYM
ncbi:Protein LST8-like protein [Morus notabilis]|uniref:Target of rapamycin complex subunit LST8 n=1 Tax=Morus notabilis TaxID=981085 RepID=W9RRA1_9ROSA|nr:Protein LST8-like protein [Morus notabilis]